MTGFPKIYDYEERLVRFAGEVYFFTRKLKNEFACDYYKNQLIRSSGSTVLNYGEAQGAITNKDYCHKLSIVVKELKESRGCLKVLTYIKIGDNETRVALLQEVEELIAIGSTMINKRSQRI